MTTTSAAVIGTSGVPRAEDEFPHPLPDPNSPLPFKDTWYLAFRDDAADVTMTVHLTLSANRAPGLRATFALHHGRRSVLETRYMTPTVTGDSIGSELLTLQIVNPAWTADKHLRLSVRHEADGLPIALDVDFRGRFFGANSATLTPGLVPTTEGLQGLGHAEQACTITGTLRWGPDEVDLSGVGYRDRSWGYRKSDKMASNGYSFVQLHLPEVTCGLLAWQSPDASPDAPLPVGAWMADAHGVQAATEGLLHLSAEGRLDRLVLSFTGGRTIDVRTKAIQAELHYPYHEPEMDGLALGTLCWDQHVAVESADGAGAAVLNLGIPFIADVLRNSRFCFGDGAAIEGSGR